MWRGSDSIRKSGTELYNLLFKGASLVAQMGLQCRRLGFDPWVGKIPWRREWLYPLQYSSLENSMLDMT